MATEQILHRWITMLERIYGELMRLALHDYLFWEVRKAIDNNPMLDKQSHFWGLFFGSYGDAAIIGIRRQIGRSSDEHSLCALLRQVKERNELLSRDYFVKNWITGLAEKYPERIPDATVVANETFDEFCGKPGAAFLLKEKVEADCAALKDALKTVHTYADNRIAHSLDYDKRDGEGKLEMPPDLAASLKYEDISKAIKLLTEVFNRYSALIRSMTVDFSINFVYDWKTVLRQPWIRQDE